MYESFFGLRQRPFIAAPVASRYFPAASIDRARQSLARCIDRAEGVGLVTSGPGTGKTLLLQVLAEHFALRFAVALVSPGLAATKRELWQTILYELKVPCRGLDDGELRIALTDLVQNADAAPQGLLLLIDDAHTLPPALLEELRILANTTCRGEARVRLVLAGNPGLDEVLAQPQLAAFAQSIAARCYLEPFDRSETIDYVRFHLAAAEGRPEAVLTSQATDSIYQTTAGIARLVNQLGDHSLLCAWQRREAPLTAQHVQEAWAELQQLPVMLSAPHSSRRSESIEFGTLPEDDLRSQSDTSPTANPANPASSATAGLESVVAHLAAIDEPTDEPTLPEPIPSSIPIAPAIAEEDPLANFGEEIVLDDLYARLDSSRASEPVGQDIEVPPTVEATPKAMELGPEPADDAAPVNDPMLPHDQCVSSDEQTAEKMEYGAGCYIRSRDDQMEILVHPYLDLNEANGMRAAFADEDDAPAVPFGKQSPECPPATSEQRLQPDFPQPYTPQSVARKLDRDQPPIDPDEDKFQPKLTLAEAIRLRAEAVARQSPPADVPQSHGPVPSDLQMLEVNGDELLVIEDMPESTSPSPSPTGTLPLKS